MGIPVKTHSRPHRQKRKKSTRMAIKRILKNFRQSH